MDKRLMLINSILFSFVAVVSIAILNYQEFIALAQQDQFVFAACFGILIALSAIPKERLKDKYNLVFFYGFLAGSAVIFTYFKFENYGIHIYHMGIIILSMLYLGPKSGRTIAAVSLIMGILYGYSVHAQMIPFIMYIFIAFTGLFIGNMIVYLNKNNSMLSQNYNEVKTLYKISNLIDYYSDTEEILYNIAKIVTDATHLDSCYIFNYNEDNEILEVNTAYGELLNEDMVFKTDVGLVGQAYSTCRKVISDSLSKDEMLRKKVKYFNVLETVGVFPLCHNGETVGVIMVGSIKEKPFSKKDIRFLEAIAGNVAKVIDNDTQYKKVEQTLKLDQLSGLYNQKMFYETLDHELEYATESNKGLYVMMMDVDKFKYINDTHGHLVGDKVIQAIGRIIQSSVRGSDYACRYGGEEFAVIFTDGSIDVVKKVAGRIQDQLKLLHLEIEELNHPITISIGISSCEDCDEDPKKLLEVADQRMYNVKVEGGDDYKVS